MGTDPPAALEEVLAPTEPLLSPADFPLVELEKTEELISKPRWIVPVLPKGELEILLSAAINLAKQGKNSALFFEFRRKRNQTNKTQQTTHSWKR